MTKETIMNTYAIKQGYENWEILCLNYIRTSNDRLICHINAVTDLIQEELKKEISLIALDSLELYNSEYEILSKAILNTEIL